MYLPTQCDREDINMGKLIFIDDYFILIRLTYIQLYHIIHFNCHFNDFIYLFIIYFVYIYIYI